MKRKSFLRSRLAPSLFSARRSATLTADCDLSGRRRLFRSPHFEPLEAKSLLAADFLITEFMADNDGKPVENGLPFLDEDGEQSDWIEIQNVGNAAGSLLDWALEDDVDHWVFPNVTVQPGGYLVVFASNKDRTDPASELHTNFAFPTQANGWHCCARRNHSPGIRSVPATTYGCFLWHPAGRRYAFDHRQYRQDQGPDSRGRVEYCLDRSGV